MQAGLFSAILTAFIIEAYRLLQRDSAELSTQILLQISQQLSAFSVNSGFINSTIIPASLPPYNPSPSSVVVNALWFAALVLSLVTASLGILVKQWYREYLSGTYVAPRERCRVWRFRRDGLLRYKVAEIASFLPLLLQLALILFFVGLVLFIRDIHSDIATLVIVLVAAWLLVLVITTLLPLFSPSCPYKTPLLKGVFIKCRRSLNWLLAKPRGPRFMMRFAWYWNLPHGSKLFKEETDVARNTDADHEVLFDAYDAFKDIDVWETVTRCVDLSLPSESLDLLSKFISKKLGSEFNPSSNLRDHFEQAELRYLLKSMVACVRRVFSNISKSDPKTWLGPNEASTLVALQKLHTALRWENNSNRFLSEIVGELVQGAWHVPSSPEFLDTYVPLRLGLPDSKIPKGMYTGRK